MFDTKTLKEEMKTYPTIFLPVENLGWEHVPLVLLLCGICSHEISLLLMITVITIFVKKRVTPNLGPLFSLNCRTETHLHSRSRDVAKLDGNAQAFQDHRDSVLRVLDLVENHEG